MAALTLGRIILTIVLLSLIILHLQIDSVNAAKRRRSAQKASRAEIDKINRLLNEEIQREIQQDATVQFDDAKAVEDSSSQAQFLLLANEARLSGNRHADELRVNNPDDYFHGDIDLTEWQALRIHRQLLEQDSNKGKTDETEGSGLRHRWKRKIGREPVYKRWEKRRAINFDFADSVPLLTRQKIREALSIWQRTTCLRFREGGPDVDRLEFFDGGGCSSFVGRTGGTQGISISTPGCDYVGIIAHEVGHALGIFHEQARPDQRQHITVHYQNIPISRWNNFHPIGDNQVATYNLPYDAGSVMHYGPFGFATDPYRPTISTLDRNLQATIGQRVEPSFLDIQSINEAYDCYSHCGSSNERLNCTHGGYPNPNDCTRCVCPSGFGGKLCAHVQASECGGVVELSRTAIYINSLNYPGAFPYNQNCIWLLKAPTRSGEVGKITLEFVDNFQYRCEDSTTCDKSYVEIKTGPDFRVTGYRFCCSIIPTQRFEAAGGEMIVMHSARDDEPQMGFRAKVWWNGGDDGEDSAPDQESNAEKPARVFPTLKSTRTPESVATETASTTTDRPKVTETGVEITEIEIIPESIWSKMTEGSISGQFGTTSATTVPPFTWPLFTFGTTNLPTLMTTKSPIESFFGTTNSELIGLPGEVMQTRAPLLFTRTTPLSPTPNPVTPVPPVVPLVTDNCDTTCGAWSAWTDCNQLCGGCGRRTRKRTCANQPPPTLLLAPSSSASDCRTEERRPCNFDACPIGTNFLFNNAEFHILWKGCCVGMFRRNFPNGLAHSQDGRVADQCAPLESNENAFIRIISSLLTAQDTRNGTKHGGGVIAGRGDNDNNISTSTLLRRLANLGHLTGKMGVDGVSAAKNNRGSSSSNGFETED